MFIIPKPWKNCKPFGKIFRKNIKITVHAVCDLGDAKKRTLGGAAGTGGRSRGCFSAGTLPDKRKESERKMRSDSVEWSVRPIEISPEIPEFMGFARHWPYFFALF